jgi:excisionase family DNA binding protein
MAFSCRTGFRVFEEGDMERDDWRRRSAAIAEMAHRLTVPPDASPFEDDQLLSEDEGRDILPVGKTLFRELAARGEIASCRIGRRRLFSRNSIRRYIAERLAAETGK